MKRTFRSSAWILVGIALSCFAVLRAERMVYPQAAVGPAGEGAFEIQLRLGNTNDEVPWEGSIRLLRDSDLQAMTGLVFKNAAGTPISTGTTALPVHIPAGQSRMYRIGAESPQVGVLLIDASAGSPLDELVASFYYFLSGASGRVADVIAVQGQTEPHAGYRVMISSVPTFNVGVAVVAAKSLPNAGSSSVDSNRTEVEMTAILEDGSTYSGSVTLGDTEKLQQALFPFQVIPTLPNNASIAQLKIESAEDLYVTTLAVGQPPEFEDVQIGAAPASPAPTAAPFTGLLVNTQDRAAVVDFYNTIYKASEGATPDWTGNVDTCNPGSVNTAFNRAVLRRINYFRAMAGVPADVVFSDALNAKCQQAALMMVANEDTLHDPPDTWTCYQEGGAEAAGKSNLYYLTGGTPTPSGIIDGYVNDPGSANIAVGHRRWILYPRQRTMGSGTVQEGQISSNVLWVVGDFASGPQIRSAWPPEGYVPSQLIFDRWSFSFPEADFSEATVEMTQGGQPVSLTIESASAGGGGSIIGDNTIVWVPDVLAETPVQDVTFTVAVHNVLVNGTPRDFVYNVTAINVGP